VYQRLGSARFRGRTTGPANISPSGRLIRSDEQLSSISIWDTATGALLWRKPEVPNRVSTESTFSPDDQLVVLVSDEKGDEFVERYSPDGLLLASVKMKFKPNQTTTLIPNGSGLIRITPTELIRHDIRTGNPVWSQRFVKRRRADNMILRFSDDNQSLALLIGNHSAIYDLRSGHVAAEFDVFKGLGKGARKPSIVFFKALSREAKLLAFQLPDDSQFLHVLEIASGKTLAKVEVGAGCDAIFDPDASHLWVMVNGTIQVYSTATWKSLRTMRFRSECVMDLHFPSQTLLLSNDGPLELCNLETGKHLPQNPDPNGRVVSVRERSGGQVVANIGEA
jgi:WD40 repeat protein